MAIIAYTGLPGSGKSYSAVENIVLPALKDNRLVCHNLKLHEDVCMDRSEGKGTLLQIPYDGTAEDILQVTPAGAVVIIDEIWRYWPAGMKTGNVPREQLSFFKEHRQRVGPDGKTTQIVIIDQELGSGVARWLRDLIETTYIHTKLDYVSQANRFRVDVYQGAADRTRPPQKNLLRQMFGCYKPEVWTCYVSHAKQNESELGEAGLELAVDKRATIWGRWEVRAAIAALALMPLIAYAVVNRFDALGNMGDSSERSEDERPSPHVRPAQQPPQQVRTPPSAPQAPRPAPPEPPVARLEPRPPPVPQESTRWRLRGVILRQDGTGYAQLVSATGQRTVSAEHCDRDNAGTWTCEIDGKIVATWTGGNASSVSSVRPPGSSPIPLGP